MMLPPGEVWEYSSAPVDLLSQIIEKVTGKTQRDFFNQEIGAAIGGQEVTWPSYHAHIRRARDLEGTRAARAVPA